MSLTKKIVQHVQTTVSSPTTDKSQPFTTIPSIVKRARAVNYLFLEMLASATPVQQASKEKI
jgi:hypothetical protein|tara:strand:- start:445 stop:630 length:186 start_codon:yes stop_codon:yes gene_type:complete